MDEEKFTPPYPKPYKSKLAVFVNMPFNLGSLINGFMEKFYTMKMGKIKSPRTDFWIVNDTASVKRIMEKEPDNFPKSQMLHEMLEPLLGESIFTTNGDKWKNQRKMMNPSFTHTNLRRVFNTMNDAVSVLMSNIEDCDVSKPVHIDPLMTHVTADIIFRTILSTNLSKVDAAEVLESFDVFQKHSQITNVLNLFKLPKGFSEKNVKKASLRIRNIFEPIIKKRFDEFHSDKNKVEHQDILDSLLKAKHPETGESFGLKELVDQMGIMFLAGHETSATALTWTLYLISKCPHMQQQAFEEIKQSEINGKISFESIKNLKILKSAFMESLRLYPPVSFLPREVKNDGTCIRDQEFDAGTEIVISPWLIHRSSNHWQDPHSFCPARFGNEAQAESVKNSFIPFGKGQRVCVGAGFAYQEALLILANILSKYKVENPKGQTPKPVSRATTRPKNGIKLNFVKR